MDTPKPGQIMSDGKSINIGAPVVTARLVSTNQQTPSQLVGIMLRHLKGVISAAEELKAHLEQEELKR